MIRSKEKPPTARSGALFLLEQSEKSQEDLSALIDRYLKRRLLERRDRALLTELVYGVWRQRGFLDWRIDQFSKVPSLQPTLRNILRLALYQIFFLDKIPPSAAVNESVELAKQTGGIAAGRLANGLLRNILRQKDRLPQPDPTGDPVIFISVGASHPEWLVRRWIARWGEEKTLQLCRSNNETPPTTLRTNTLKISRAELARRLEDEGASAALSPLSSEGLYLKRGAVGTLPSYQQGLFYIQDEGAQLISYLVDPRPGETLLDLCAAPGGKSTHLVELMKGKGEVVATDIDPERLNLIEENVRRLQTPGVSVEPLPDAAAPQRRYDRILIDAPCSALGILRRIPEGKWKKRPSIIPAYAKKQRELLEKGAPLLKKGGRLIYATCSTEPEENEEVVENFTLNHPEFKIEHPAESLPPAARKYVDEKGYFTTLFNSDKMDQFFGVRWVRKS
ncbi:MAG TPA: 16S rRNA (cytosine(967)-C(5))-methyltransferase RsmB [Candidatus Manganitrophaceae bacterium]|nr:16S rRNA (cytosine(967)-C(5))-methyltransferase RsmB [Candidatus Manganitrophaceae bacterium]